MDVSLPPSIPSGLRLASSFLAQLSALGPLGHSELRLLEATGCRTEKVARGETVLGCDAPQREVAVLASGSATLVQTLNGKTAALWTHLPGDLIGADDSLCELSQRVVIASSDSCLDYIDRCRFEQLSGQDAGIGRRLDLIARRERLMQDLHMASLMTHGAEHRLKYFLLRTHERIGSVSAVASERFKLPFTQTELGALLNFTSIYASRLISRLRVQEEIDMDRRYYRLRARDLWIEETGYRPIPFGI